MPVSRRTALGTLAALAAVPAATPASAAQGAAGPMYGMVVKMRVQPGQRDALIAILAEATVGMPGCLAYVIAKDKAEPDVLWITETWDSAASHKASRDLPAVRAAVVKGRPMIASAERVETEPVAGVRAP